MEFTGRITLDPGGLRPKETRYAVRPAEEGDLVVTIGDPPTVKPRDVVLDLTAC